MQAQAALIQQLQNQNPVAPAVQLVPKVWNGENAGKVLVVVKDHRRQMERIKNLQGKRESVCYVVVITLLSRLIMISASNMEMGLMLSGCAL